VHNTEIYVYIIFANELNIALKSALVHASLILRHTDLSIQPNFVPKWNKCDHCAAPPAAVGASFILNEILIFYFLTFGPSKFGPFFSPVLPQNRQSLRLDYFLNGKQCVHLGFFYESFPPYLLAKCGWELWSHF